MSEKIIPLTPLHRIAINANGVWFETRGKIRGWRCLFCLSIAEAKEFVETFSEFIKEKAGQPHA